MLINRGCPKTEVKKNIGSCYTVNCPSKVDASRRPLEVVFTGRQSSVLVRQGCRFLNNSQHPTHKNLPKSLKNNRKYVKSEKFPVLKS